MNGNTPERGPNDDRVMMGVAGLLFIPLTLTADWALFVALPRPRGPWEWAGRVVLDELAIAATLFFTIGFLWAITGNRLLKRLFDAATRKFAWILIPLAISFGAVVVGVMLFG